MNKIPNWYKILVIQQMVPGKLDIYVQKNVLDPYLNTIYKNYLRIDEM